MERFQSVISMGLDSTLRFLINKLLIIIWSLVYAIQWIQSAKELFSKVSGNCQTATSGGRKDYIFPFLKTDNRFRLVKKSLSSKSLFKWWWSSLGIWNGKRKTRLDLPHGCYWWSQYFLWTCRFAFYSIRNDIKKNLVQYNVRPPPIVGVHSLWGKSVNWIG